MKKAIVMNPLILSMIVGLQFESLKNQQIYDYLIFTKQIKQEISSMLGTYQMK